MIEYLLIIAFLFLVAIFFYKQALEEFDILQIEGDQLDRLPTLITEQSFIVVRSLPPVQLWSAQTVKEIPRIQNAPYGKTLLIDIAEARIQPYEIPTNYPKSSELLSEHTGIRTWVETTWLPKIIDSEWKRFLFSARTEVSVGEKGLRKTTAYSTMILPTEGDLLLSVMPESSQNFLPKIWKGKPFGSIKRAEAPLIGEVKFLDIKVRKGSAVFVPPHWIVNIQPDGEQKIPWFLWSEFHHPLSRLAHMMSAET
jgi:hypothetical protein